MSYIFEEVTGTAGALSFKFNGQFALKNYNVEIVNGNRLKVVSTSNEMFSLLEADVSEVEINGTVYSDPNAAQLALTSLVYTDAEPVVLTEEQYMQLAAAAHSENRGIITPSTPIPSGGWQKGWYTPKQYAPNPGTLYSNAGNLRAIEGNDVEFYFNGVNWDSVSKKMPQASQNIAIWDDIPSGNFPLNYPYQVIYADAYWYLKEGMTASSSDLPSYTSTVWAKVNKSDNYISKISENSIDNKTISTVADKIIRNETFDQTFEIPPRIDGVLRNGQYIKPNGTITPSTGTRQTIEVSLTAGVTAFFKAYNVGASGNVPNAVFVNATTSVATVVSAGAASTSVAEPYEGSYTATVSGTLYVNVDSRPEFSNKYLYYNDSSAILTLSYRKKMLSANRLDLKLTSIAHCGDSITAYGLAQTYGKGFQLLIQESLKFGTSTTYATGGYTLANLNANSSSWLSHNIFSLLIGINDHRLSTPLGVLADFDNNTNNGTFYAELRKFVNKVYTLNANASIIMCTPTQVNTNVFTGSQNPRDSFWKNSANCDLNDYAEAIRTVAKKYSFPLADLFSEANQNILNIQQLTYEGVHQFSEGYRRIANIVMSAINKVI